MDEKSLRDTYKLLWSGVSRPLTETVFTDLLAFAEAEPDPIVRAGRFDAAMRLFTMAHED